MQQMMNVVEVAEELGRLFAFGGRSAWIWSAALFALLPLLSPSSSSPSWKSTKTHQRLEACEINTSRKRKQKEASFFQFSAKMNCASGTVVWSVSLNIWLTPISSCHHIHQIFTDKVLVWLLTHVSLTLFSGKIFDSKFWVKLILDGISGYFPV